MESNSNSPLKVLRCMIISESRDSAEEFAKWLTNSECSENKDGMINSIKYQDYEFRIFIRWPGCPNGLLGSTAVDALIIRIKDSDSWAKVYDYVRERSLILFKMAIVDEDIPNIHADEHEGNKPNIILKFSEKKNFEILSELIKAQIELDTVLKSLFLNLDKSNTGFITMLEMEQICRELGVDVTHSDFQETIKLLDFDHDNKISFDDFSSWYKNGRQCSKLMENIILMRLTTSNWVNNLANSKYLDFFKEKVENLNKEKKELINSFASINIETLRDFPEITVGFDSYFGGEFNQKISKSYVQNFEEGLKATDLFVIIEFQIKDRNKTDQLIKILTSLTNLFTESFRNISRKVFAFFNNDLSIKVLKKAEDVICLSLKIKKSMKLEMLSIENSFQKILDDEITQKLSLSFCVSGDVDKVKLNPTANFLDSFQPAACLEVKAEILKKNLKLISKTLKPIPSFLKLWLKSYGGSHISFNFNLDYLKSLNNSILQQQNQFIVHYLKNKLTEILNYLISQFGTLTLFKKFWENVNNNFTIVVNTPQLHATIKIDISKFLNIF